MNAKSLNALLIALVICFGWSIAWSAQSPFPANATFTTLTTTPLAIEGLTGDNSGNLYTVGRHNANNPAEFGLPCPVWKINLTTPSLVEVGNIPAPSASSVCAPLGLAFNAAGDLFVADGNRISFLTPNAVTRPTASVYATGVPGTNGVAFDHDGNLWTGDGGTGLGRVWKITGRGADCATEHLCQEVFRIQPMNNGSALGGLSSGVGRVNSTLQPDNNPVPSAQNAVANGLAFNAQGNLLVADTARGALWLVTFDKNGNLVSKLGCDATFSDNTLCLENLFRADPRLEGVDGIALDISGDIWASVNERNAIVFTVFFGTSDSVEVFRNPVNSSGLRNSATNTADNNRILEFPTSPFLSGTKFCTANGDNNRRDNSPNTAGEIGGAGADLGKISCMDQPLGTSGLPLPR
jgi:sugar lactone lactonase YvrE